MVRLNVWENGFSLDDGPLREFSNPDNQRFMRELMEGFVFVCNEDILVV